MTSTAAPPAPVLVRADVVARTLGIGRSTIYAAAKRGELPSVRVGRTVRFDVAAVTRALIGRAA